MLAIPLLPLLAVLGLASLVAAAVFSITGTASQLAAAHIAFALGVMPLIHAAIVYFVPVLSRGAAASRWLAVPPLLALAGGGLAVAAFYAGYSEARIALAVATAGAGTIALGLWSVLRVRTMVGRRHPGMDWYLAALGMLALALAAVALMAWYPEHRRALRLFHLHANLLGFIGLTALGTLQVLVPTCVGRPDPGVAGRLRRLLPWALAGGLLIATGASGAVSSMSGRALSLLGGGIYLVVVLAILRAWWVGFGQSLLVAQAAQSSLLAALLGLGALLVLGMLHSIGWHTGHADVPAFVVAFLLPLVSGAVAQLLPVWLRPGPQGEWHARLRARLCRHSGYRGLALLFAGLALAGL